MSISVQDFFFSFFFSQLAFHWWHSEGVGRKVDGVVGSNATVKTSKGLQVLSKRARQALT